VGSILEAADQPSFRSSLRSAIKNAEQLYFERYRSMRQQIIDRLVARRSVRISGRDWLTRSNPGLNSIMTISKTALDLTEAHASENVRSANQNLLVAGGMVLFSIGLACFATLYLMWRVVWPLRLITQTIEIISDGNLEHKNPFKSRPDEIGKFARAIQLFRDGSIERQRLETELVRNLAAREVAEKSNRVKSEFLANMSHELRTPFNAILGFSDMIGSEVFGPVLPRYREYANDIHGAGTHLLALINDILDISKAEAGKLELHLESVDLENVIRECVRLMRERAAQQDVRLSLGLTQLPPLFADRLRIKQVILNLLSNAIKFTPEGGRVSVETSRDVAGSVVLCVRDTGIGIKQELIPFVFEPFRQIDSALSRKFEGTGLGLSLVKTFVELHDGKVTIESSLGNGTSVFASLPASRCIGASTVRSA
jgi:signal transduction histidine kinase